MEKICILYICTGKYSIFWENFYESSQKYFLVNTKYEIYYYVFTDATVIPYEDNLYVKKIFQEQLNWPFITLFRFKFFTNCKDELEKFDYIYFFNANMYFVDYIDEEILPSGNQSLAFLQHSGFFDKPKNEFPYERNPDSLAFVPDTTGKYYFQGALNGGTAKSYLLMIDELSRRVEEDLSNNIIAVWHDESHLNKYAIEHEDEIKILSLSYGYDENSILPFTKKIIIIDKNKYGGHGYLRNQIGIPVGNTIINDHNKADGHLWMNIIKSKIIKKIVKLIDKITLSIKTLILFANAATLISLLYRHPQ